MRFLCFPLWSLCRGRPPVPTKRCRHFAEIASGGEAEGLPGCHILLFALGHGATPQAGAPRFCHRRFALACAGVVLRPLRLRRFFAEQNVRRARFSSAPGNGARCFLEKTGRVAVCPSSQTRKNCQKGGGNRLLHGGRGAVCFRNPRNDGGICLAAV